MIQYGKIRNFKIMELKLNLNLLMQAIENALIILSLIFQEEFKKLFEKYKLF